MLPIESLKVNRTYQRPETTLVQVIADEFNPLAFGCILVAEREDKSFWIVDGQQRTAGAKQAGYTRVPAIIFESAGPELEASLFRFINEFRRVVTPMDIFRASLIAEVPTAVGLYNAVRGAGFKIALREEQEKAGQWPNIGAISQLRMIFGKSGPEGIAAVLGLLNSCWPGQVEALRRDALRGVSDFVRAYGVTLDLNRVKELCAPYTMAEILARATAQKVRSQRTSAPQKMHNCVFDVLRQLYRKKVPSHLEAHPPQRDDSALAS